METFTVKVDRSGRIVLPAKVRDRLNLTDGSELLGVVENHGFMLKTRAQALHEAQDYFSRFRPRRKLLSEELIEERRKEARRERAG